MTAPPLADAHLHLFRYGYHRTNTGPGDQDLATYELIRQRHGIGAGLVVGYEGEDIDPGNNAYLRSLSAGRDWLSTVAFVPASPPPSSAGLEKVLDAGHRGISVYCDDQDAATAIASWPAGCWRVLESRNALVSVNAAAQTHQFLSDAVRAAPNCRFLFSHLGLPGQQSGPPSRASAADQLNSLTSLASTGHCWVKLSGLYAVAAPGTDLEYRSAAPFVDRLLEAFGVDKCLWGSDFSPSLDHGPFERTLNVPGMDRLTAHERDRVMGANLSALLGFRS